MFKSFLKIIKREDGQVVWSDLIIVVSLLAIIGFTTYNLLTPTVENSYQGLVTEVKTLKGGGM